MSQQTINLRSSEKITILILLVLAGSLLTGCGSLTPTVEPLALLETQAQPVFKIESTIEDAFEKPAEIDCRYH